MTKVYSPLEKMTVTSAFGPRNAFKTSQGTANPNHSGVDLRAVTGTQVYAPISGMVTKVVNGTAGFGKYVDVKTANGYTMRFAHLSAPKVSVGQTVQAGQVLALSGATGNVTGAHLHFGVYDQKMTAVDPLAWLDQLKQSGDQSGSILDLIKLPTATAAGYTVSVPAGSGASMAAALIIGAGLMLLVGGE
ncbi:MAG: M23 family metallopeptidase [Peptococcaceae bacterium]|nr:M23 family metallopeptidase [Peptococcaceae bacterium]